MTWLLKYFMVFLFGMLFDIALTEGINWYKKYMDNKDDYIK